MRDGRVKLNFSTSPRRWRKDATSQRPSRNFGSGSDVKAAGGFELAKPARYRTAEALKDNLTPREAGGRVRAIAQLPMLNTLKRTNCLPFLWTVHGRPAFRRESRVDRAGPAPVASVAEWGRLAPRGVVRPVCLQTGPSGTTGDPAVASLLALAMDPKPARRRGLG